MVGKVGIAAEQDPGGLGFADPPRHTRLRHMLTPHFTTRALAKQAPRVRRIIDEALDDIARPRPGRGSRSTCRSTSRCPSRRA